VNLNYTIMWLQVNCVDRNGTFGNRVDFILYRHRFKNDFLEIQLLRGWKSYYGKLYVYGQNLFWNLVLMLFDTLNEKRLAKTSKKLITIHHRKTTDEWSHGNKWYNIKYIYYYNNCCDVEILDFCVCCK